MDKIVILTSDSGADPLLITCLGRLFPDVEIEIREIRSSPIARLEAGHGHWVINTHWEAASRVSRAIFTDGDKRGEN